MVRPEFEGGGRERLVTLAQLALLHIVILIGCHKIRERRYGV